MGKLKNFFGNAKKELKLHWNTPDIENGKYVSWREHLDIFGSVAANYAAQAPLTYIGFGAWCFLIMYHYNLPYIVFTVISLIGIPLSYLWNILGWFVADNLGILPKKTEKKLFIFYFCAIAVGLLLILTDFTKLINQESKFIVALDSIEGISARSFFKIFGVQILTSAFGGARGLFWRKKLIPKYGRYKYVLYSDCIQKCILIILVGWLPLYNIVNVDERVWLSYLLFSIFGTYDFGNKLEDCTTVISPNPQERLWVRAYTVKFCHVLNSLVVAVIPMLGHFDDINFFRFVIPGVFIPFAVVTMLLAGRIKERIPQPPIEKKQPVPFWYGVTQVMRNKYHWLNLSSSVIDALGNGMLNIQTIIFLYTLRLSGLEYSLLGVLWATRTALPTFFAPHFLKKYSFRALKIFKQLVNITTISISVLAMLFLQNQLLACGIILFLMSYLGSFLTQITRIAEMDMDVRLRDYQMYLSGERIENFTNVFNWFSSPVVTLIGLVIPLLLLTNGFNSNWDVLLLDSARFNILAIPMIIDLVGHIFMIIPFSFWDYDNKKHKYVIDVLVQREKLANEGYFPQTYEGGLDFEKPSSCKGGVPVEIGAKKAVEGEGKKL